MQPMQVTVLLSIAIGMIASLGLGQEYGKLDQGQPGDEMIQRYLKQETERLHEKFAQDIESREKWEKLRPAYRQEYLYMLGHAYYLTRRYGDTIKALARVRPPSRGPRSLR